MKPQPIKVLIVESCEDVQRLTVEVLGADPRIDVVGTVKTGEEAMRFLAQHPTDVVLIDVQQRQLDGFETTRRLMETKPLPIIVCSNDARESVTTFRSLEAGAVACVQRLTNCKAVEFDRAAAHLRQTVKLMSEVKVVRRWPRRAPSRTESPVQRAASDIAVIGIGSSTGGPPVLQTILSALPKDFPVPLLVVQHIAPGFLPGLVEWLNQTSGLTVQIAAHGIQPLSGHAYIAPDDFHLTLDGNGRLSLNGEPRRNGLRPSIDCLFDSLAEMRGGRAVGVLLTGMGRDGADGLKQIKDRGGVTIVQDRDSCVVHGMPGAAIALDAVMHVLPPERIAATLVALSANRQLPRE